MHWLGSNAKNAREMDLDDILHGRIKLLVRMTKDYLDGATQQECQLQAMENNAIHVEQECQSLSTIDNNDAPSNRTLIDREFLRYLKHLAMMAKAAAKGHPLGDVIKKEMQEIVDIIARMHRRYLPGP